MKRPSRTTMSALGEAGLIDYVRRMAFTGSFVKKGIGDDTAVLAFSRSEYLLFTTDMLTAGVHFRKTDPARAVGHKALACSISDIAAMGGVPLCALVSLGLPRRVSVKWVREMVAGMNALARKTGVSVAGGDTVASSRPVINVALLGKVEKKSLVTRGGAKPGDVIYVTGRLGGSLPSGRHLTFPPRLKEARLLVKHARPSAMMDISDGLVTDLGRLLKESRAGAAVNVARVPRRRGVTLSQALFDGEDFELLFTLPESRTRLLSLKALAGVACTAIGRVTGSPGKLLFADENGKPVRMKGKEFCHF